MAEGTPAGWWTRVRKSYEPRHAKPVETIDATAAATNYPSRTGAYADVNSSKRWPIFNVPSTPATSPTRVSEKPSPRR